MPRCISCNEVYADQLRRCPHCGDRPEGHRPESHAPAKAEQPKSTLGYAARRKRMRFAVLALIG
ncbi:MAG: hypothetical protein ACYTF8_14445, partial [Planctomycetota bacterium]